MNTIRLSGVCAWCATPLLAASPRSATCPANRLCLSTTSCSMPVTLSTCRTSTCTGTAAMASSRRWYTASTLISRAPATPPPHSSSSSTTNGANNSGAAHAPATTAAASRPPFARLSTAAEAVAELRGWLDAADSASAQTAPLTLSGKSLVLCVAALQLQSGEPIATPASATDAHGSSQQERSTSSSSSDAALTQRVHRYLAALAHHVYTQTNSPGKPRAAWQLFHDVETDALKAETLHTSLHFLQHYAFAADYITTTTAATGDASVSAALHYESQCAARDLELTFEALEVLLAGRQISEIHRAAQACEEVGSPSTTAAMVPPAEAAVFYMASLVDLTQAPLVGGASDAVPPAAAGAAPPSSSSSSFTALPPAKQQFWAQAAQQLTVVLYLALLVTKTNSADSQLVSQAFAQSLRSAYGVRTGKLGLGSRLHYLATVAVPYALRSLSTIMDVLRAQQSEAAKAATAAAKAKYSPPSQSAPSSQPRQSMLKGSTGGASAAKHTVSFSTSHGGAAKAAATAAAGSGSGTGGKAGSNTSAGPGQPSDKMNKITLMVVCVAAVLYAASSTGSALLSGEAEKKTAVAGTDAELVQSYQKLSAMAASAATSAPAAGGGASTTTLMNALQKK